MSLLPAHCQPGSKQYAEPPIVCPERGTNIVCCLMAQWELSVFGYLRCTATMFIPSVLPMLVVQMSYIASDAIAGFSMWPLSGWGLWDQSLRSLKWTDSQAYTVQTVQFQNVIPPKFPALYGAHKLWWKIALHFPITISTEVQCSVGFLPPSLSNGLLHQRVIEPFRDTHSAHCRILIPAINIRQTPLYRLYSDVRILPKDVRMWTCLSEMALRPDTIKQVNLYIELILSGPTKLFRLKIGETTSFHNIYEFGLDQDHGLFVEDQCLTLSLLGVSKMELLESGCVPFSAGKRKADVSASDESRRPHKKIKLLRNSCFSTR